MSHIFDALQRSEAERSGNAVSPLSAATELLERAERGAASRWNAAPELEPLRRVDTRERATEYLPEKPSTAVDREAVPESGPETSDVNAEVFAQFRTLDLSLTPQNRLVTVSDIDTPAAEAFRLLSVRLRHLRRSRDLKKLLITST